MWALGDYPAVASEVIPELGAVLVQAAGVTAGDRVLDVAAGSGNAAIAAALAGADVVASDLTPELLRAGELDAARRGAELEWREADAEALPFGDGEFDAVVSCVGVMFAPNHRASAGEMLRVCRPGGTIGLVSWTPEGFIGEMFAVMKPYAPPPLWGRPEHVQELFGDRVDDIAFERRAVRVERFGKPEEFRDFFKARYGPTVAVYRRIEGDLEKVAELDLALAELARRHDVGTSGLVMEWEYLIVAARRR
ncbi:class I SAM-dependent methyltransferase [Actinomadura bangladeshensis]|uniref:Class I SAM-dependent methyltransferase n=2 Tax=Actinomadura bangladeshensis TaxID=453573 RepID=A0A6L9QL12_9ACTN|nr:class I SAM-dependent methyltransferase [Actinomadura bangladeshensis]